MAESYDMAFSYECAHPLMIAGDDCRLVSTSMMMIIGALGAQMAPLVAKFGPHGLHTEPWSPHVMI